jgi:hypothetical protein
MSAPEQAPGGVYVSRPGGESGLQPSLVTTFSPDHPGHPANQPAPASETHVDVASELPDAALRVRYEEISRAVINRLVVDPDGKADALDRMDELLTMIDVDMTAQAKSAEAGDALETQSRKKAEKPTK